MSTKPYVTKTKDEVTDIMMALLKKANVIQYQFIVKTAIERLKAKSGQGITQADINKEVYSMIEHNNFDSPECATEVNDIHGMVFVSIIKDIEKTIGILRGTTLV